MKLQRLAVVLLVLAGSAVLAFGQPADPWFGTWKVNLEKSTYDPGPKPTTARVITLEAVEGGQKITADTGRGGVQHLDGKDYPLPNNPAPNATNSYRRIDARTWERSVKEDGKVVFTAQWAVSTDGKTLTVTQKGKNNQGQTVNNVIVYDRQQ
jgi:hypothetical protein